MSTNITRDSIKENDYTVHIDEPDQNVWLILDGFSLNITRTAEGITVAVYPVGGEADSPALAELYAYNDDLKKRD